MKRLTRLIGSLISIVLVLSCLPLESIADEIADSLKCRSLNEASYTVQENVISEWPGHANIEIVFTNTGDTPIYNWNYSFDYPYNIENPYCCSIVEHEGDLYTITNAGWNKDINPGESVTIGFTASSTDGSDIEIMPSFYLLNNEQTMMSEGAVTVEYQEYSDWTTGSSGVLILTNNTENAIGSWTLSLSANRPITDAYGFTLSSNEDGTYTITGDGYTEIPAGGSVQIGIQCGEHDSSVPFEVTNASVYSSTLAINLNEDSNGNGIPDVAEIDSKGFIEINTPTPTAEPTPTETPTDIPTDTPEPTPTEFVFTPDQDLDGDGLYTNEEEMYGTDPNNPDSDGDGVSDGYEIRMMYFPTIADSDSDGVVDGDEDFDGDGIINRDEESYGTCPYATDSDYDGINDYAEIFTYNTDPYEEDSDGDYILDGDELTLGLDPTTDTSEGVKDNENTSDYSFDTIAEQISEFNTDDQPFTFSFDITAAGCVDKYIKVEETGYKYAIEDNSTILGKSPEIVYDYAMKVDSVTVRYTLKNGYEAEIDKYCIFYYWEGYNILIPIETEYDYDTGTVYATNSMIGTYCLVDTDQMYELLGIEEEEQGEKNLSKMLLKGESDEANQNSDSTYSFGEKKTYNGHEYFLITSDTPMLYDEAVAVCDMYGGYPAVITSSEENNLIASITDAGWIGGGVEFHGISNPTVDWITDEECTFTYWALGSYNANDFPQWEGFPLTFGSWGWRWRDPETYTETRVICECEATGNNISALTFGEETIELNNQSDSDIDGDGILDYQELSSFDLGTFDSVTGVYVSAALADYCCLAELDGISINADVISQIGKLKASSYRSDPQSIDRDADDYSDYDDGLPFKENENLVVILACSSGENCKAESKGLKNKYLNNGIRCEVYLFNGYISFVEKWSEIGDYKAYALLPFFILPIEVFSGSTDFYYYNVTDVVLISHSFSTGLGFDLGESDYLFADLTDEAETSLRENNNDNEKEFYCYFIEDINTSRRFDTLDLMICDSATQLNPNNWLNKNIAETFLSEFSTIKEIYAFDCFCCLLGSDLTWSGDIILHDLFLEAEEDELSRINLLDPQDFREAIIMRYYDSIAIYQGQVRYERYGQGFYYEPDLFSGKDDILYEWYITTTESDFENNIYMYAKYADPLKDTYDYDPVLNKYLNSGEI
ncbi:MAG: cellulose binding domain-containing protein [Saccharofermentans sp.]|nr:cellulose binding domain-containing protein [Saccharofermentans sp.]